MEDINNSFDDAMATAAMLDKSLQELNKTINGLDNSQAEMATRFQNYTKVVKDVSSTFDDIADALKKVNLKFDENARVLNISNGSLDQNKARLNGLLEQYQYLTKEQGDHATGTKSLNTQIGQLSVTIADQEKKLAKSRQVFDFHKGSIDQLKTSFEGLKTPAGDFGHVLEESAAGFNAMKTGLSVIKTGFQGVGGAIKATGFGLLVTVLQSVTTYFTETTAGTKKLQQILAAIGVVTGAVKNAFASLGEIIVNTFTHPIESLKQLGNMIMENFINRFKAVLVIWDGIKKLDFKQVTNGVLQAATGVTNLTDKTRTAYKSIVKGAVGMGNKITKAYEDAGKAAAKHADNVTKVHRAAAGGTAIMQKAAANNKQAINDLKQAALQADQDISDSKARVARLAMTELEKELADVDQFYDEKLKAFSDYMAKYDAMSAADKNVNRELYDKNVEAASELTNEKQAKRLQVLDDFNKAYAAKILQGQKDIEELNGHEAKTATEQKIEALQQQQTAVANALDKENETRTKAIGQQRKEADTSADPKVVTALADLIAKENALNDLNDQRKVALAKQTTDEIAKIKEDEINRTAALAKQKEQQRKDFAIQTAQQISSTAFSIIRNSISSSSEAKLKSLEQDKTAELSNTSLTKTQKKAIEDKYKAKEAQEKAKAFKEEQLVSISQAVINGALAITKVTAQTGVLGALVIPGIIAETAIQIATIAALKAPRFARGGQFVSDGRGALLPGYSRTDNTNAYLRSGEAVVVSEAMRNPWARNLVSAINVAHGGRDFSVPNPGNGYAIGGIFTDGGNANRYYNQPVNDAKDLANTLAYQMINNFPPIYVDVKDVNNQQNILAQTVNRVNL